MDRGRVRHYGVVHARRLADYAARRKGRIVLPALLLAILPAIALAQPAPDDTRTGATRTDGTWIGTCAATAPCTLRYRSHLFSKAGVTVDLEIRAAGADRVPVIIIHGLPHETVLAAAVAERVHATLRLDRTAPAALVCTGTADAYICQPDGTSRDALSRALPAATRLTLSLSAALPGQQPTALGSRAIPLAGTERALRQASSLPALPSTAPNVAAAAIPPGWQTLADQALRSMGFQNGTASLSAMLAKLLRR